jgi:hypothetical protein
MQVAYRKFSGVRGWRANYNVTSILVQNNAIYRGTRYEELSWARRSYNTSIGSHEVRSLERREYQPSVECRKTYGRGAKRTEILGMGCSTPRLDLWRGSLACRTNGRILLVNRLHSSRSTFSRGSFLSFFAFQEGMLGTPTSVIGG